MQDQENQGRKQDIAQGDGDNDGNQEYCRSQREERFIGETGDDACSPSEIDLFAESCQGWSNQAPSLRMY